MMDDAEKQVAAEVVRIDQGLLDRLEPDEERAKKLIRLIRDACDMLERLVIQG